MPLSGAPLTFIGGFFGIEFPPEPAAGLAALWKMPADPALCYANGRSALAALLASVKPPRLWLPAYVCGSVAEAAAASGVSISFFPVDAALEPDTAFLADAVAPGDMVLAVDYFGRAPNAAFRAFVHDRPDLGFIEDACQAIDTGMAPWGRWRLHSPRKLLGVPDGGFIVPADAIAAAQRSAPLVDYPDTARASMLRFEDEGEESNAAWHAANQAREAAETVTPRRMSRLARALLRQMPLPELAARRRANYRLLAATLPDCRFIEEDPTFVPLGFPIRLPSATRDAARQALLAAGIFPAIHWAELPAPAHFAVAHRLSLELLTLPCDHRYGVSEMQRMLDVLRAVI